MAMQTNWSEMGEVLRPGDLLSCSALISTRHDHETVGSMVAACRVVTPVFYNWEVRRFCDYFANFTSSHTAIVFGPQEAVRERFLDIHSRLGTMYQSTGFPGARVVELRNGVCIVFGYLQDENFRGFSFDSVWVVLNNPRSSLLAENRFHPLLRREPERNITPQLSEVRSGYRGAVRAQYVQQLLDVDLEQRRQWAGQQAEMQWREIRELEMRRIREISDRVTALPLDSTEEVKPKEEDSGLVEFPQKRRFLVEGE